MHISFSSYFQDPQNGLPLELTIIRNKGDHIMEGAFSNEFNSYPIIDGIPRFVISKKNYSNSFGFQWGKWPTIQFESENKGKPMEGHTLKMFNIITDSKMCELSEDDIILDIGCGSGRFIDVIKNSFNNKIVGIDYSSAVQVAYNSFIHNPNICIVQADALMLPFQSNIFNAAYSIGVLHHTPNPYKGIQEANRCLKSNGWFGLSVYSKDSYYARPILIKYRKIFKILMPFLSYLPPLLYSYFTIYIIRIISLKVRMFRPFILKYFPYVALADLKWSILDTFDSVTPIHASTHTTEEVNNWLDKAGFFKIKQSDWGKASFIAIKLVQKNE